MDGSPPSVPLIIDPFSDLSGSTYRDSSSTTLTTLQDDEEISTYGKLVSEIHRHGSKVLRYYEDYLKTRSSAPPEETPQYEFVSKGDYLCAGRDFTVYAGHLFKNYNTSPSFPRKRRDGDDYGDHKFVKPWSGTTASSSTSMSADSRPTRIAVALKESVRSIHQSGNRPFVLGTFLKEIRVMGALRSCANIVDLLGVAFVEVGHEVKPTLVVELALGNLIDFFRSNVSSATTWELRFNFTLQICSALQALHSEGIVHADIKGQNVLVFPNRQTHYCAKLSDFGNSTLVGTEFPVAAGTKYYLAPECISLKEGGSEVQAGQYGNAEYRDVYAFGLVVWEMATSCRQPPFADVDSDEEIVRMKFSGDGEAANYLLAQAPATLPQSIQTIIRESLDADPTRRPCLGAMADQLRVEIEQISSTASATEADSQLSQSQSDTIVDSDSILKIPWSLQKRLYEESTDDRSDRDESSKVFLAYCYLLCSDDHQELRDKARSLVRQAALLDPFCLTPGAMFTPFRAMMELQDWEGISEILPAEADTTYEVADQCIQHIYSFGWRRFVVLACSAGSDSPQSDSTHAEHLRLSSEKVAVSTVRLLSKNGVRDVGQASWGEDGLYALHMASVTGKHHAVSALLTHGAQPDARDKDNRTALHLCCQAEQLPEDLSIEVVRSILAHEPNSVNNVIQSSLYTPLRLAVEAEKPRLCQFLLQNGADVNAQALEGSTALQECAWSASEKGNGRREKGCKDEEKALQLAKVLLQFGKVNVNLQSCHNSVTAIGIAAVHGNFLKMVSLLLDYGADPNTAVDELTALGAAVQHDNPDMLSLLLKRGADPNLIVRNTHPLGVAVVMDKHEMVLLLLEHGADPRIPYHGVPLVCWAIHSCKEPGQDGVCPNLHLLLQRGASVTATAEPTKREAEDVAGLSAVHFTALKLSTASLGVLLDHKVFLSARSRYGQETALHVVVAYTSGQDTFAMVKELVRRGIDLDAADVFGDTALHIVSMNHADDIRQFLLEAGCNPNIQNASGRTAQQLYDLDEETLLNERRIKQKAFHELLRSRHQEALAKGQKAI